MAIRNIVKDTDEYNMLHKKCRPVTDFNQKLWDLLDDMAETMYKAEGVGLAGPQVGMLRRVFVIDVGDGILEFINPEILETAGEQNGAEGCLSFPGEYGLVERPNTLLSQTMSRSARRTAAASGLRWRARRCLPALSATRTTTWTALSLRTGCPACCARTSWANRTGKELWV